MMVVLSQNMDYFLYETEPSLSTYQLHQVMMCDAELKKVSKHYEEKRQELSTRSVVIPPIMNPAQQKRQPRGHNILEIKNIDKVLDNTMKSNWSYLVPALMVLFYWVMDK